MQHPHIQSHEMVDEHASVFSQYIKLLSIHQWIKNIFCFTGVIFTSGYVFQTHFWILDTVTFVVFSLASSSIYILEHILDRGHPETRENPIASGAIRVQTGVMLGFLLALVALGGAYLTGWPMLICLLLYLVNNVLYVLKFRYMALFDVLSIALSFVLRMVAGVYVFGDNPTAWATLCIFFLSLFLAFAKRRVEMRDTNTVYAFRPGLKQYPLSFLDNLLNSSAAMTILCYAPFTIKSGKNPSLVVTVPVIFFAIMYFKRIVMVSEENKDPIHLALKDNKLRVSILFWLAIYFIITIGDIQIFL